MSEDKWVATLVRGSLYVLSGRNGRKELHFHREVGLIVSSEVKEYLEGSAIDTVLGEVDPDDGKYELVHKAKFAFEPYEGDAAVGDHAEKVEKPRKANVQPATTAKSRKQKAA